MQYQVLTRDQHFKSVGPKRILALDGGGLRGILSLGYLARMEELLRARFGGDPGFRLAHYFDLIAGTSTGAIIAAALAKGLTIAEITTHYQQMGKDVFKKKSAFDPRKFLAGLLVPKYGTEALEKLLQKVLGKDTTLGDPDLLTGLLVVTKRTDTGSPWPLGNNPEGKYFHAPVGASWTSNAEYPLWKVVRASTAAPTYFEPETIAIGPGKTDAGSFVDGGVSPFNNPSLQAFMYATLAGYGVQWTPGENNLMVVSVGTGSDGPEIKRSRVTALDGVNALSGLMDDCASLVETMMQWMSNSAVARNIDGEIENLAGDLLGGSAQFHYLRYNVTLTPRGLETLGVTIPPKQMATLPEMDNVGNLELLQKVGESAAAHQMLPGHFPALFDLA